ncbi:MAG: hypothetical protein NTX81_01980 [Candidatus Bathyarchaeota archaeon]|nr:hypothetical protein [Candidatus Bathyarchaeota archaeon]
MVDTWQIKYAYLVSVIGVVLMAITVADGVIRVMFPPAGGFGGNRQFGNMTAIGNMNRSDMNPFGLTNNLAILAIIIAIVGLMWLGLSLRKLQKGTTT